MSDSNISGVCECFFAPVKNLVQESCKSSFITLDL